MRWPELFVALPGRGWWPLALAAFAPVVVFLGQRWRGRERPLGVRVAGRVAFLASVGFAVLVVTATLLVFRTGLVQLSVPSPDELARTAGDVDRVRRTGGSDPASLRGRLALIDAADPRVQWSAVTRLACDTDRCVVATSPRIDSARAPLIARAVLATGVEPLRPVRVGRSLAMVRTVPLRNEDGVPDAVLAIGFDADDVARQAERVAWGLLAFTTVLWIVLVAGTQRAVTLSVGDRLRLLTRSLARSGTPSPNEPAPTRDDLDALGRAVDAAVAHALRQESRFRALVEHAPVGVARVAGDGRVEDTNPRFRAIVGLAASETPPSWSACFTDDADRQRFLDALAGRRALDAETWRWRDGAGRDLVVRASLVPLPDDDAPAAVLLVEDIGERLRLEAQLQRAQKLDLVGRIAGGIAHDFNNLLTVVRANVEALRGVAPDPELAAIDDAASRGARLVRRLLTVSRADMLAPAVQPLGPVLFETIAIARRVLPAGIRVVAPTEVPDVHVALDRDAIEQVLLNLLLNARDAIGAEGTITLAVAERTGAGGATGVGITVEDDGIGMSAEVLARATEPFFSTKPAESGSGLGLAMVATIMAGHHGQISIESTPATGTRVTLWFPRATTAPSDIAVADDHSAAPVRPVRAVHLLLVEDEHAVRTATARSLERAGWQVTATDGMAAALAALDGSAGHFDLVISDVMMPGGTGVDLHRAVRARGNAVPFLFVSGYAVESLDGVLDRDPRTSLLAKPWSARELRDRVEAMLTAAEAAGAPTPTSTTAPSRSPEA